jgi:hypothetical protein
VIRTAFVDTWRGYVAQRASKRCSQAQRLMARIAAATGQYSGLYEYVRQKSEERADRRSEYTATGHGGWFRCPHHRRLEAMRRGEPVAVPS